jgi:hypothetical protein
LCIPGGGNIRRATDEELHRRRLLRRGSVLEYVTLGWTAITAAVVFALVFGRSPTGAALGNPVLAAEGRITLVDAVLAVAVVTVDAVAVLTGS